MAVLCYAANPRYLALYKALCDGLRQSGTVERAEAAERLTQVVRRLQGEGWVIPLSAVGVEADGRVWASVRIGDDRVVKAMTAIHPSLVVEECVTEGRHAVAPPTD
jgi:hypothetical protein